MTHNEQNKILDAKIESNVNQYKVDRMNAEISAFSSGDLNKYEFLTRKYLKYKPNALDKARFQFSPLGQTLNRRPSDNRPNDEFDNRSDDVPDDVSDDDGSVDDVSDLNKKYNSLLLKYFHLKKYKRRIR